jgi:GT2 family glycosyltransferase
VAEDDLVLLINDDVEIGPDFLQHAVEEIAGLPETLLLARQVDAATGQEIDFGGGVRADLAELRFVGARTPGEINCLPTRGLFLRWRDLRRVGGFRPAQLPHYFSDYEFTIRAGRRGLALRVARHATLGVQLDRTGRSLANLFQERRRDRFRLLFSQRYKDNPVTWTRFAWLAAPRARLPYLCLKIWGNFLITVARCVCLPVPRARLN